MISLKYHWHNVKTTNNKSYWTRWELETDYVVYGGCGHSVDLTRTTLSGWLSPRCCAYYAYAIPSRVLNLSVQRMRT